MMDNDAITLDLFLAYAISSGQVMHGRAARKGLGVSPSRPFATDGVGGGHPLIGAGCPPFVSLRSLQAALLLRREVHGGGCDILLNVRHRRRARDGKHLPRVRKKPGEGELTN